MSRLYSITLVAILLSISCAQQKPEQKPNSSLTTATKTMQRPVLVIHGGAGSVTRENIPPEKEAEYKAKLQEALEAGYTLLKSGASSEMAVVASIKVLENSPLFNAGVGAVLTHNETNELDASIMNGKTGQAGAVAGVNEIKSPIEAAQLVMNNSKHVLLTGKGAHEFAQNQGLEMVNANYFKTEKRLNQIRKVKERDSLKNLEKSKTALVIDDPYPDWKFGTVGAVALDKNGNLAAGTSTGGMTNKRYGRIGDSPIIGAGTYANNNSCAVSATGHGEFFIRNVVAFDIAAKIKYQGKSVGEASQEVIDELRKIEGYGGVICLDTNGNIAMPFNTQGMFRGFKTIDSTKILMFGN